MVAMIPSLLWLLADVQYRLRTVIAREGKEAAYGREIAVYRQRKFQLYHEGNSIPYETKRGYDLNHKYR